MNGFIFGFQRFVWCPKWTPASNNSGTNSVVSAISEIPEGGRLPEREREDAISSAFSQPEIQWLNYANFATESGRFWGRSVGLVLFPSQMWRNKSNGNANPTAR